MQTFPHSPAAVAADTDHPCPHYATPLFRNADAGLIRACLDCGAVVARESDDPHAFADRFGFVLTDSDCDCDGPGVPSRLAASRRRAILRARRGPGPRRAAALRAARRFPAAVADSALASVGIWRW